tara:strand:- start:1865 stop:2431 length:567 start_codon:yes stop_codon:yes gene_type:complete
MATIPDSQKFHTVPDGVDTVDKGSAQAAADRKIYTMQDIKDTVSAGGGVDGSGTATYLPIWSDANTLGDSKMVGDGDNFVIPETFIHDGDTDTSFGFSGTDEISLTTAGSVGVRCNATATRLYSGGNEKMVTQSTGVKVAGQMNLNALNTAPASASATGTVGEIRWTDGYVYLCTATDTWLRAALTTW